MSQVDQAIRQYRTSQAELTVLQAGGAPLAHQTVTVAQTNHKFLFGSDGFDIPAVTGEVSGERLEVGTRKVEKLAELCNFVTLPFYWGRFEPVRGQPITDKMKKTAQWCVNHNLLVKGHPLCWHTVTAEWLLELSNEEILAAQLGRIQREVSDFRGLIDMWDVLNEGVIMPIFDKYDNGITRICKEMGRIATIRTMFEAARAANPGATLLLNDFDISPAFDILVEGCLEAGIEIDSIGIQSHMHQGYWGPEKTLEVIEHFTRFNLPIHFTETTIVSGQIMPPEIVDLNDYQVDEWPSTPEGEARQAEEVVLHYKTLFAHPAIHGVTWWDISDGGWLHAPAGLVRQDGSSKPAYDALLALIKGEWWTPPTQFTTDAQGRINFTGFLGDYELSFEGQKQPFALDEAGPASYAIQLS